MNKVIRVFFDTDMRNGISGLIQIAEEEGLEPKNLKPGEFLVFLNARQTIIKLFASDKCYAYFRPGGRLDQRMIEQIPRAFNGTRIDFTQALEKMLAKKGIVRQETKSIG